MNRYSVKYVRTGHVSAVSTKEMGQYTCGTGILIPIDTREELCVIDSKLGKAINVLPPYTEYPILGQVDGACILTDGCIDESIEYVLNEIEPLPRKTGRTIIANLKENGVIKDRIKIYKIVVGECVCIYKGGIISERQAVGKLEFKTTQEATCTANYNQTVFYNIENNRQYSLLQHDEKGFAFVQDNIFQEGIEYATQILEERTVSKRKFKSIQKQLNNRN